MTLTRRQLLWLGLAGGTSLFAPLLRPIRSEAAPASPKPDLLQWMATADGGSGDGNQRAVGSAMAAQHRRQRVRHVAHRRRLRRCLLGLRGERGERRGLRCLRCGGLRGHLYSCKDSFQSTQFQVRHL